MRKRKNYNQSEIQINPLQSPWTICFMSLKEMVVIIQFRNLRE